MTDPTRVSDLLARYAHIRPPDAPVRRAVAEAITRVVGIAVSSDTVTRSGTSVYVHVHPAIRREIQQHHTDILQRVQAVVGEHAVTEIR